MAPDLTLTTGQVLHALWRPRASRRGRDEPSDSFKARLIYLRRVGVPFSSEEARPGSGFNLVYGFQHLAELAVAMELIDHGIAPADVAALLVSRRAVLTEMYATAYERAYERHEINVGALQFGEGFFLEMTVFYEDGKALVRGPRLLTPAQATTHLLHTGNKTYSRFFIALSELLRRTVQRALTAPDRKRGRASPNGE